MVQNEVKSTQKKEHSKSESLVGVSAREAGFLVCHECHKVVTSNTDVTIKSPHCPRCDAELHERLPNSLANTWAWLLTALILYFPANILPIMTVDVIGNPESSTIMDGVIYFVQTGSYEIALVIFTASVVVPLFKISGMIFILLTIHYGWKGRLRKNAGMLRFIEFIGRWSMLDVYVVALMVALVQFGFLTSIEPEHGATFFALVVITSMLAVHSFDPRLLWDKSSTEDGFAQPHSLDKESV